MKQRYSSGHDDGWNERKREKNPPGTSWKLEINDGGKMLKEKNEGKREVECKWQRDDSMQNASSNYNLINKLTVFLVSSSLMCSTGFSVLI